MLNLIGQLDFGQASSGAVADVTGMHIRWFDRWLKGIENGLTEEPPVKIFVMGDNIWRDEKEWPLARTRYTRYFLHSNGQANSRSGDDTLSEILPDDEPADNFLYDPKNPAPSNEMGMGAYDQQDLESRPDILVYSSLPLETNLEVTGPVQLIAYASSSAVDTDFSGKLVDVWPNGRAYNVAEGIVRGRYLKSIWEPEVVKPEEIYEYAIDLGSTSNVFKAGHRIRVEISSSNFPKWDRNLNTGLQIDQNEKYKLAMQTVLHDVGHPSHILLPVIIDRLDLKETKNMFKKQRLKNLTLRC
jgi:putative CocE/NonD family hydrolase